MNTLSKHFYYIFSFFETIINLATKNSFDFCQATEEEKSPTENLGQVVFGERIRPSPYKVKL